jgi:hypothetical protein
MGGMPSIAFGFFTCLENVPITLGNAFYLFTFFPHVDRLSMLLGVG